MLQRSGLLLGLFLLSICTYAQKITYKVSFPNAVHHEAVISITASGIQTKPAVFRMSRSSPGRYATHEFGKNVYDVKATDKNGNAAFEYYNSDGQGTYRVVIEGIDDKGNIGRQVYRYKVE